ncbi:MAG: helicase-related protein [Myxococcota bacterium]
MVAPTHLPIEALRDAFDEQVERGPVVVSAPTGSGKSTRVPVWCAERGPVLVVEPRRVACRALASRVAEVEGHDLGAEVGYRVRSEHRASKATRLLFATPGIVLNMLGGEGGLDGYATVILDEFHERRLDTDLILALLKKRWGRGLVVMSATLQGERVADYLDGVHLEGEGRLHPVDVRHRADGVLLPDAKDLDERVRRAVRASDDPGDVLVFLPGKGEIADCAQALRGEPDLDVVELHGGLALNEQARAFGTSRRRKVILSTNVAETSVTVPGVGVVVDSGLVRRTRYHQGRGFLVRTPVAMDSAVQRAGRAGRTGPGVCVRLWDESARLEESTPPEVHRESLVPLLLAAAAAGERVPDLDFVDPPKDHAVEHARGELRALGALDAEDRLTERGRKVFGLPLDVHQGRLLVEAEDTPHLPAVVDLVSALAVGRPIFRPRVEEDLRRCGCDATALVRAVRFGKPREHGLNPWALEEARRISKRLRKGWHLPPTTEGDGDVDREALARIALAADPRCAHVARRRKKRVGWSNGGTEIELARESAVEEQGEDAPSAIAVLDSRALGLGARDTRILATCAIPLRPSEMVDAGLGRDRLAAMEVQGGVVVARIERVHARRVLATREEVPTGALAREAIRDLFLRGTTFKETLEPARERLEARALHARLNHLDPVPSLEDWVLARLEEVGVESGEDLALLTPDDLLPDDLDPAERDKLDRDYPRTVDLGSMTFTATYDLVKRDVVLEPASGKIKREPPVRYLPRFRGLRVMLKNGNAVKVLRSRR